MAEYSQYCPSGHNCGYKYICMYCTSTNGYCCKGPVGDGVYCRNDYDCPDYSPTCFEGQCVDYLYINRGGLIATCVLVPIGLIVITAVISYYCIRRSYINQNKLHESHTIDTVYTHSDHTNNISNPMSNDVENPSSTSPESNKTATTTTTTSTGALAVGAGIGVASLGVGAAAAVTSNIDVSNVISNATNIASNLDVTDVFDPQRLAVNTAGKAMGLSDEAMNNINTGVTVARKVIGFFI